MDELKQSSDGTADRMTELAAEQKKLNEELDTAQSKYDIATRSVNNWESQINRSKATETELNRQIRDTSEYLDEAKRSADGCATTVLAHYHKAGASNLIGETFSTQETGVIEIWEV